MYIVLLQDGILCRHMSFPLDLWCHLVLGFVDFFYLDDLSIGYRGVSKLLTTLMCYFCSLSLWCKLEITNSLIQCKTSYFQNMLCGPWWY
jgi:hypothetical protein